MQQKFMNIFRVTMFSFIFSLGVGVALAGWVAPIDIPPGGNTPPPINTGSATQTKGGNLFLSAGNTFGATLGLFGQVGIGTTAPTAGLSLDVEGNVGAVAYCDQNGNNCIAAASLAGVPAGTVISVARQTPPSGYLQCDGQQVSRTQYAALFAAIGTTFGAGNGSTTFNVPNLTNKFVRGAGSGRAVGTTESDELKSHSHGYVYSFWYAYDLLGTPTGGWSVLVPSDGNPSLGATTNSTGGAETRPMNVALLPCIKY